MEVCRYCQSFRNQNTPYLAIGRKIARITALRGNLRRTYIMFKTWLLLELGYSNFARDFPLHDRWDILNKIADRGNLDSDQQHFQLNRTELTQNPLIASFVLEPTSGTFIHFKPLVLTHFDRELGLRVRRKVCTISNYPNFNVLQGNF